MSASAAISFRQRFEAYVRSIAASGAPPILLLDRPIMASGLDAQE